MRAAVLCDFLDAIGGGERIALFLSARFRAPIITTNVRPDVPALAGRAGADVRSLGTVPRASPFRQIGASIRFARARLGTFDRLLCVGNFTIYAGARHPAAVWYCLTPTRAFFDLRGATLQRVPALGRPFAAVWSRVHGAWERRTVRRIAGVLALSETVRGRMKRVYGRDARVVYPPVATSQFRYREVGDFWLSVNRLFPEKRIDLQMEIFRRLPRERLVVIGGGLDGTGRPLWAGPSPPNVTFAGEVGEERLRDLYGRCRGLLATAVEEDFGLTPVEAMASGKCVLATDEGGYRESVIEGETGYLLPPRPDAFAERIRSLNDEALSAMRPRCEARASEFDEAVFLDRIEEALAWTG